MLSRKVATRVEIRPKGRRSPKELLNDPRKRDQMPTSEEPSHMVEGNIRERGVGFCDFQRGFGSRWKSHFILPPLHHKKILKCGLTKTHFRIKEHQKWGSQSTFPPLIDK